MEEKQIKDEEKKIEQQQDEFVKRVGQCADLLNLIIAKTLVRHNDLDDEAFKAELGFKDSPRDEDALLRLAIFNLLVATSKEVVRATECVKRTTATMKLLCEDDKEQTNV